MHCQSSVVRGHISPYYNYYYDYYYYYYDYGYDHHYYHYDYDYAQCTVARFVFQGL